MPRFQLCESLGSLTKSNCKCRVFIDDKGTDFYRETKRGLPGIKGGNHGEEQTPRISDAEWLVMDVIWENKRVTSGEIIKQLEGKATGRRRRLKPS